MCEALCVDAAFSGDLSVAMLKVAVEASSSCRGDPIVGGGKSEVHGVFLPVLSRGISQPRHSIPTGSI